MDPKTRLKQKRRMAKAAIAKHEEAIAKHAALIRNMRAWAEMGQQDLVWIPCTGDTVPYRGKMPHCYGEADNVG